MMDGTSQPSKEQVREWFQRRRNRCTSLPSIKELQHELNWRRNFQEAESK
jgi:hypothetical protein